MAITSYSELKTAVASFLHRSDLTTEIDDFIDLAEADMQVRARLAEFETTATVTLTSGVGSLPSDFFTVKAVRYPAQDYTLEFVPLGGFDEIAAPDTSGQPTIYTIRGSQLLVYPLVSADMTLVYTARFTPLSASATTNSIITKFPDAYLNGSLYHACVWLRDAEGIATHKGLFEEAIGRIRSYVEQYKYPNDLRVRVA